ncbi:MAG: molybdate ABC transporter substrate-binding protein [Methanosarcinaceae archaeon]|nr:molybdate ABC transporter substrate-binding protein [Methanosarcinaceae archaeon]
MITIIFICCTILCGCIEEEQGQIATNEKDNKGIENSTTEDSEALLVYCGAGMREPMDEIGVLFEQKYGTPVNYNYAGSNTLLSQIELIQQGDVYMPGATYYYEVANEKGFTDYEQFVAYHIPVITVPKGNPAGITSLEDLAKPEVKVILGDPKACAIGVLANSILEKNGISDEVLENVVTYGATVNELVIYMSMGQGDASIIWKDLVVNNELFDVVEISEEQNTIKIIPIATLTCSNNKDTASKFVDFVISTEGKKIFEKHGFTTYPDERYEYVE